MNKKGFTLIELLAIIIILGIIAVIAVVSVTGSINRSKDESFIDLAKNYVTVTKNLRAKDGLPYDPKNGEAIIIPYGQIDNNEIVHGDVTGYGNIIPSYCFISVVNNRNNYLYYVNQMDDSYHILDRIESNSMSKDNILSGSDYISLNNIREITTPLSTFNISYGSDNYNIKAVGTEFDAKYIRNGNQKYITSFDLKDQNITFKGVFTIYDWLNNSSDRRIELKVINNEIGELNNITYTFKKENDGYWYAITSNGQHLVTNGSELVIDVKRIDNDYIEFSLRIGNKKTYESIMSTSSTKLYGYFSSDESYLLSNTKIKGNITDYDNFITTGRFPISNANKSITIDGIDYEINSSKISYVIVNK